ncbi:MAG: TadE/TadG family type IV pilus assembly protein [Bryobacteraceae bacterium]
MKPRTGHKRHARNGQALIEFALILPLLFLFIINVVNLAGFFYAWINVSNAARNGASFLAMGGATPLSAHRSLPTATNVKNILTGSSSDLSGLPHYTDSSYTKVFVYATGVPSADGAGPADLESTAFADCKVEVQYLYKPFITAWDFSRVGIHLTWPPAAGIWVKRSATTRMMQ